MKPYVRPTRGLQYIQYVSCGQPKGLQAASPTSNRNADNNIWRAAYGGQEHMADNMQLSGQLRAARPLGDHSLT
ncbi:hypothetical protein Dimus_014034, partial [Dionaea muscipula]